METSAPGEKRFEIKKWNAVALWAWGKCTVTHFRYSCGQLCYLQKSYYGFM